MFFISFFFFNDTAPTEIYTLSLHDALPIYAGRVESEDQLLVLVGDGLVAVALLDVFRDLEPPEGVDLQLRRAPPRRVAAPHDPVGAHVGHELPQDMGGLERRPRHRHREGGAQR